MGIGEKWGRDWSEFFVIISSLLLFQIFVYVYTKCYILCVYVCVPVIEIKI